jgi:hypothetical protein
MIIIEKGGSYYVIALRSRVSASSNESALSVFWAAKPYENILTTGLLCDMAMPKKRTESKEE